MKRIVLLGSTGSIGCNVLDVVDQHPDRFAVVGLAARGRIGALRDQCRRYPEARFAVGDTDPHREMTADPALARRSVGSGEEALCALIEETRPDLVVNALVGFVGLRPTLAALESGIPVAVANKEAIVTGGELLLAAARASGAAIIPVDSEHVAIAQCLSGARIEDVDRIVITASGGSLRETPLEALDRVTVEEVLAHPTWNMGAKITVDSATMVNKGLEVIEAHRLFGLTYDRIEVVLHPQSIVHSLVRFVDGSIVAQMSPPDMRMPILYALSWPERTESSLPNEVLEFPTLSFDRIDPARYPAFALATAAGRAGGGAPTVLNAANEFAVTEFLAGRIPFTRIHEIIARALDQMRPRRVERLEDIIDIDRETRELLSRGHGSAGRRQDQQRTENKAC